MNIEIKRHLVYSEIDGTDMRSESTEEESGVDGRIPNDRISYNQVKVERI